MVEGWWKVLVTQGLPKMLHALILDTNLPPRRNTDE